jgi:hypothetical protein
MFPRLNQKYNVEPTKLVSGKQMDAKEFEARIQGLLPDADRDVMQKWLFYAQELTGTVRVPLRVFLESCTLNLPLVKQHDGNRIARELFNAATAIHLQSV